MEALYLDLHSRYRLRALASLYEGVDSPGYVANWKTVKALETSTPAKYIAAALIHAGSEVEGSEGNPRLKKYWEIQVRIYQAAIKAVREVEGR